MKNHEELNDARLRELAQRLGARGAERVDAERTAVAVVARLRQEPRASRRPWLWIAPAWARAAAAIVVVIGAGLLARSAWHHPPAPAALVEPVSADVSDLSADQLRDLVARVGQPDDSSTLSSPDAGLDELTGPQLRALLEALEG